MTEWVSRCASVSLLIMAVGGTAMASALQGPGLFRDLDHAIAGDAIFISGRQLFVDDYVIGELRGAQRMLNQPVKHPANPLFVRDKPWEGFSITYGSVLYDADDGLNKMWYQAWRGDEKKPDGCMAYATSRDGIAWEKPIVNEGGVPAFRPAQHADRQPRGD